MKKKIIKSNNLLISFIFKALLSNAITTALLLILFSQLIFKLDLGDMYYNIFSTVILFISSLITPLIAAKGLKNNIFVMSLLSNALLILITVINSFSVKNVILIVIEFVVIIASSFLASIIISKKKSRFKV